VLFGVLSVPAFGQDETEITAGEVYPDEMDIKAFTLKKDSKIKLDGTLGLYHEKGRELVFYGWILNGKTRETVWHMLEDKGRFDKGVSVFRESVSLPKGEYEIYYTAELNRSERVGDSIGVVGRVLSGIFGSKKTIEVLKHIDTDNLKLTVSGSSGDFVESDPGKLWDILEQDAVVSITKSGDDSRIRKAFSLKAETHLRIYALGEGNRNAVYDYAWIENIQSGKRVWTMNGKRAREAGGGDKNIRVDKELTLPAGTYLVHYITDDSHSYDEWNTLPPDDPRFWGVTLWPVSGKDRLNAKLLNDFKLPEPVLELVNVGNKDFVSSGLKLSRPMELRVLCVGEGDADEKNMSDYGWIVNAVNGKRVWEINGRRTGHAGGAAKNRMMDEIVHLDKGSYIVNYVTDGSHSSEKWNAAAPFDPERWGITVWVTDEKNRKSIETMDPDKLQAENVIAQITRVTDGRSLSKTFALDTGTRIRVLAVGEGTSGDMVDYGWITDKKSGDVVWEMTYRKTEHAGGARKNRSFDGTLFLKKGEYELFYKTDDSHSYMDWNARSPDNPEIYGITLIREK
ncbi:MAG: hypothetical protein GY950_10030, partial [bacterium]|nr:hypothetical protein [bacterium]